MLTPTISRLEPKLELKIGKHVEENESSEAAAVCIDGSQFSTTQRSDLADPVGPGNVLGHRGREAVRLRGEASGASDTGKDLRAAGGSALLTESGGERASPVTESSSDGQGHVCTP